MLVMLFILFSSSSCKKFLEAYSQNETFSQTAADLEEILIGQGYPIPGTYNWMHLMDDDAELNPGTHPFIAKEPPVYDLFGFLFWQQNPFLSNSGNQFNDEWFESMYKGVSAINTVLYDIPKMQAKGEPVETLKRLSGEAHFLRAMYYYYLANVYGKPYAPATAATDLSIPLKTDPAIEDRNFTRNSVKEVFQQILNDLHESEKELEGFNQQSVIKPNLLAVQAFLSRIYLHMSDYENAIIYANKVTSSTRFQVIDLNNFQQGAAFLSRNSPEIIFCMPSGGSTNLTDGMQTSGISQSPNNYQVSADLKGNYTSNDLRPPVFFELTPAGEALYRKAGRVVNLREFYNIRLPEILLNKAEAQAATGRNEDAIATIQILRRKRFKPEHLTPVTATGADLVSFIREERRRELCFDWHRWFDLRRYGVNPDFPYGKTIRHNYWSYNNSGRFIAGYYELKPYQQDKAAYLIPIPRTEIEQSGGALTNEARVARPIQ